METYQEFMKRKKAEISSSTHFKDIGRKGKHKFFKEAATYMVQHNLEEKVFVIERLRREEIVGETAHKNLKKGDIEYRIGYYIAGKIRKANGRWVWGQFCPLIPSEDFNKLFEKAQKERTLLA